PVTGSVSVVDVRTYRASRLVSQAKPFHRYRPVTRHYHLAFLDQAESRLAPELGLQIEHQAALVAIGEHEERANAVAERLRAPPVALPRAGRRLDLDHVSDEVRQESHRSRDKEELRDRRAATPL